jgi:hypothetical protein
MSSCGAPPSGLGFSASNCLVSAASGVSEQGAFTAPRLAGQRRLYIEKEIAGFSRHMRDNPSSRQYMWGVVAALSSQSARELAVYFSTLPPKAANDGDRELAVIGRTMYELGVPDSNVVSGLVWHGPDAEGGKFRVWGPFLFLFETMAGPMARGIPCGRYLSDAARRAQSIGQRNRRPCLVPQFHQVRLDKSWCRRVASAALRVMHGQEPGHPGLTNCLSRGIHGLTRYWSGLHGRAEQVLDLHAEPRMKLLGEALAVAMGGITLVAQKTDRPA